MTQELVNVTTGEVVQPSLRLTPAQAKQRAIWVRDVTRAALEKDVDYGIIPGTGNKQTLLKPGAEMLLLAAGLGFTMDRVDDDDSRHHEGVTYKCTVRRGDTIVASCDGYAGYDESRFRRTNGRADWNSLVKMAQKRALVGAALNAVAGSGLFHVDPEDAREPVQQFDAMGVMKPFLAELDGNGRQAMNAWSKANQMPPPHRYSLDQLAAALVQIGRLAVLPACETSESLPGPPPGETPAPAGGTLPVPGRGGPTHAMAAARAAQDPYTCVCGQVFATMAAFHAHRHDHEEPPADLYDDLPESRGDIDDLQPASYEDPEADPGRPFDEETE